MAAYAVSSNRPVETRKKISLKRRPTEFEKNRRQFFATHDVSVTTDKDGKVIIRATEKDFF